MGRIGLRLASMLAILTIAGRDGACGGGGKTVDVTLREFEVVPAESSVEAGEVTFEANNTGPDDVHETVCRMWSGSSGGS